MGMKPINTNTLVSSDSRTRRKLPVNSQKAGVLAYIMGNLYHNPAEAVLREYATNARDAHRQIGSNAPVEISLPGDFDPTLTITDHGVGLSSEEVFTIFGTYNNSTKDESNEQAGMFGIGSKSAFGLASQFSVRSVKDGLLTYATFLIDEDGDPALDILAENIPTDEASGVSVSIPVSDVRTMNEAATKVFAYWPTGSIVIDGTPNTCVLDRATKVDDTFYTLPTGGYNKVVVVMDSVPYALTNRQSKVFLDSSPKIMDYNITQIFLADLGSVMPNPSREVLSEDAVTMEWLTTAAHSRKERLTTSLHQRLAALDTMIDKAHTLHAFPVVSAAMITSMSARDYNSVFLHVDSADRASARSMKMNLAHAASLKPEKVRIVQGDTAERFQKHAARAMKAAGLDHLIYRETLPEDDGWLVNNGSPAFDVITVDDLAALDPGRAPRKANPDTPRTPRKVMTAGVYVPVENNRLEMRDVTMEELALLVKTYPTIHYINGDYYQTRYLTHGLNPVVVVPNRGLNKTVCKVLGIAHPMTKVSATEARETTSQIVAEIIDGTSLEDRVAMYLQYAFNRLHDSEATTEGITNPILRRAIETGNHRSDIFSLIGTAEAAKMRAEIVSNLPRFVPHLERNAPLDVLNDAMNAA